MLKWAQQTLANVAGTQEPLYGPSALRSVAEEADKTTLGYTELKRKNEAWETPDSTCVVTKTFYVMTDAGHHIMAQVIYSNVIGIRTTCQYTCKIHYPHQSKPHVWSSTQLSHYDFSEDKANFYADDCAVELAKDGLSYTIKSVVDVNAITDLTMTRKTPAVQAGNTGRTLYGQDLSKPWGSMRHYFWPRCESEGTITTKDGIINLKGKGFFVFAIQGMKPHHAAARWNFANFQGPAYSAMQMEFTTPPSYGSTVVNVSLIAKDGEIVFGGCRGAITHTESEKDKEVGWAAPKKLSLRWNGKTKEGKDAEATMDYALEPKLDRVDVMAEVPGFVKAIISTAAGTRPYIYSYFSEKTRPVLKMKIGDEKIEEEGVMYNEASFVTE